MAAVGKQVVVSWPVWATNLTLEISSTLGPEAVWSPLTNALPSGLDSLAVTNEPTHARAFYRLNKL